MADSDPSSDTTDSEDNLIRSEDHITDTLGDFLAQIALLLNSHLISFLDPSWATSAPRLQPRRYLFPTSTFAAGLWGPGEDVHLVCLTEDRRQTFFQIVEEALVLEGAEVENGTMRLEWSVLGFHDGGGEMSGRLAGSGLYLHYASLPPNFDLSLVPEYGIPEYLPSVTRLPAYNAQHVDLVRHALTLNSALDSPPISTMLSNFETIYALSLRPWAAAMGLLAPGLGLLDGKTLLNLAFGACQGWLAGREEENCSADYLTAFFLRRTLWMPAYHSAVGANAHGGTALQQALEYTSVKILEGRGVEADRMTRAAGFQAFLSTHDHFILVSAEYWDHKAHVDFFRNRVFSLLKGLALRLTPYAARVWPVPVLGDGGALYAVGVNVEIPEAQFRGLAVWLQDRNDRDAVVADSAVTVSQHGRGEVEEGFGPTMGLERWTGVVVSATAVEGREEKGTAEKSGAERVAAQKAIVETGIAEKSVAGKGEAEKATAQKAMIEEAIAKREAGEKYTCQDRTVQDDKDAKQATKKKKKKKKRPAKKQSQPQDPTTPSSLQRNQPQNPANATPAEHSTPLSCTAWESGGVVILAPDVRKGDFSLR